MICARCGEEKPQHEFYYWKCKVTASNPEGRTSYCKECWKKYNRERHAMNKNVKEGVFYDAKEGRLMEHYGYSKRIYWSKPMIEELKRNYPYMKNEEVAGLLGVSQRTMIHKARELGLRKDEQALHRMWDENRKIAHAVNRVNGVKTSEKFFEAGKAFWFKKGDKSAVTREARLRGWETRRRNARAKVSVRNGGRNNDNDRR